MGYYRCPNGRDVRPFDFFNNGHGLAKFWEGIVQMMRVHDLKEVVIGFESTGPYAEPLIHYLRRKPVRLVQVNPMHTKRLKELQGNSPNKTDRKDPKVIANIIELGHALTLLTPEGPAADLHRLTQARERSVQGRSALFNTLQHLVFVLFPELLQMMKNVKTRSARYLLSRYPTPPGSIEMWYGVLGVFHKEAQSWEGEQETCGGPVCCCPRIRGHPAGAERDCLRDYEHFVHD